MSNGITSFLTQGTPVPAPTGSDASTSFPLWLQSLEYNLSGAAGQLAGQPYQQFPGPQVATPSAQTQQAWNLAGQNVGSYQPYLNNASALTNEASQPLTAAQIQNFVNPYQNYVTQGLDANLTNNILPQIQAQFVGAGQVASPQQAQVAGQAAYNTQQAVGQSLAGAYQGAVSSAQQQQAMEQAAGAQYGQLGALQSELGAADVSQLGSAGAAQDTVAQNNINAAINNFTAQQQWPYQNLSYLSNIERGAPINTSQQVVGTTYLPPSYYNPSPLSVAGGVSGVASSLGIKHGGHVRGALARMQKKDSAPPVRRRAARGGALAMLRSA